MAVHSAATRLGGGIVPAAAVASAGTGCNQPGNRPFPAELRPRMRLLKPAWNRSPHRRSLARVVYCPDGHLARTRALRGICHFSRRHALRVLSRPGGPRCPTRGLDGYRARARRHRAEVDSWRSRVWWDEDLRVL